MNLFRGFVITYPNKGIIVSNMGLPSYSRPSLDLVCHLNYGVISLFLPMCFEK